VVSHSVAASRQSEVVASSPEVAMRMSRQRSKDTVVEIRLRQSLHSLGLRFRIHQRPLPDWRREADILFRPSKVVVMVDGCFWHGCPVHGTWPSSNADWWREKIEANRRRDQDTSRRLADAGWLVIRVWEHDEPDAAARQIAEVVEARRPARRSS